MTGLLVSVRDAKEARRALAGGADVIDVKEPRRGALGAADPQIWQAIQQTLPANVPLSIALGELSDESIRSRIGQLPETQFAKVGLANCVDLRNWQRHWERLLEHLPAATQRVAVAYADHELARSPAPIDVLRAAPQANCHTLLLDTFTKDRGDLFQHLDEQQLAGIAQGCHAAGINLVLAGSLSLLSIPRALALAPALIAVRGAACQGDRNGTLCDRLVKQLKELISSKFEGDLISS